MATMFLSGSAANNDGGVIVKAGSLADLVTNLPLADLANGDERNGSVVVEDSTARIKAVSSGTFAFFPEHGEDYLLHMAGPNAAKINGVASDVLSTGGVANEYVYDGIMELNSTRDSAGNLVSFGDDNAAGPVEPSRSVPGSLVYMQGGKTPNAADYKAKNVAE